MKPNELDRLGKILGKHLERWGFYYCVSFGAGFLFGTIVLLCLTPKGTVTASDLIISVTVGTLGFSVAAINQSIAWVRSFGERRHKKKLRRMREIKELEVELELDEHSHEMVH